jgi:hypothetical protein
MIEKDDWRLVNQWDYLSNKNLYRKKYVQTSETWDHDHCKFCHETISDPTKYYYCTEDEYYWICEECYNDFKNMFNWHLIV